MFKNILLLMTVITIHGCGSWSLEAQNKAQVEKVRNLAKFDLDCEKKIKMKVLAKQENGYVEQIGAIGCGKKMRYVHTGGGKWVANTKAK